MEAVTFLRNQLDGVQQELSDLRAEFRAGELSLEIYNGLTKPLFARASELEDKIQKALSVSTPAPAPPGNFITLPQVLPHSFIILPPVLLLPSFFRIFATSNY
jgi:hypothetical protein